MELTSLRLLLAMSIAVSHFFAINDTSISWILPFAAIDAVPAFFVISGWVISASYGSSKSVPSFYARRIFRIYPAYALVIVLQAVGVLLWAWSNEVSLAGLPRELASYLFFNLGFANFVQPTLLGFVENAPVAAINPSLWTMKIEVGFYLLLPLLMFMRRRWGAVSLILAMVASTAFMMLLADGQQLLAKQLPGQLRHFLAGMLCYMLVKSTFGERISRPVWGIVGIVGLVLLQLSTVHWVFEMLKPLSASAFVIGAATWLPRLPKAWPDLSYGIYLLHAPLAQFAREFNVVPANSWGMLAYVAVCMVGAYMTYRWIEQPGITVGKKVSKWFDLRHAARHNETPAATAVASPR